MQYLPSYSPDLSPLERGLAKIKAPLRIVAARTNDTLWDAVGIVTVRIYRYRGRWAARFCVRGRRSSAIAARSNPCQDELDRLLEANEAKPLREQLTLIRILETLREGGYAGGQDAVRIVQPEGSFLDADKGSLLRAERHRHLPDLQGAAVQNVLKQAEALLAEWAA